MKIGPLQAGRTVASANAANAPLPNAAARHGKSEDSVTISDDARKRLAQQADELLRLEQATAPVYARPEFLTRAADSQNLDTEHIRSDILNEVQHRIESGYYEREDIKRLIADRLSEELDD